jgi:hypothetical protein
MTKETSEEIATLAAKYMRCPQFDLVMDDTDGFSLLIMSSEIKSLAASCLAQREQPEPSISYRELREMIKNGFFANPLVVTTAIEDMIALREKESEK